jgi:hypothetical protein
MRWREIFREAGRNLATGTTKAILLGLIGGAMLAGLVAFDGSTIDALIRNQQAFAEQGADTWVLKAPEQINGRACEALNALPNVRAAGAVKPMTDGIKIAQTPSNPMTVMKVTPQFPHVMPNESELVGTGLIVSQEVLDGFGLSLGEKIPLLDATTQVAASYAYPADGRTPGMGWTLLEPTNEDLAFDECWAKIDPYDQASRDALYTALLPGDDQAGQPQLTQLNARLGLPIDAPSAFTTRLSSLSPLLAAVVMTALAVVAAWSRRLELASTRHAGVSAASLSAQLGVETAAWAGIGALCTAPVICYFAFASPTDAISLLGTLARIPLAGLFAGIVAAIGVTTLIRENRLFRYFKVR